MTARRFTAADNVVYQFWLEGCRLAATGDGFTTTGGAPTQRGAGANMSIDVAAAGWRIGGTAYSTAGVTNVAVTAAHATLPRQDLVYANAAGIQYLVGTAAAAPSSTVLYPDPPDLPASSIPIALIEVAAGVTSILDARIIDCRSMLSGYGGLGSPVASAVGDASADGTATTLSRSDHKHAREAFATPAIALGTAAAAGVATTPIRSDATIVAFDATVPAAIGSAAAGSQAVAARRDHVHATGAGTPTTMAAGDLATAGTGPAAAMTDHKHGAVPAATATVSGLVPTPPNNTTTFLRGDATFAIPAISITSANSKLGADVTMTTAGIAYDGPSLSLVAGTWLVIGHMTYVLPAGVATVTMRIGDGTTHYASQDQTTSASNPGGVTCATIIVLGGTTTIKIQALSTANSTTMKATANYSAGNNATQIAAVKLA